MTCPTRVSSARRATYAPRRVALVNAAVRGLVLVVGLIGMAACSIELDALQDPPRQAAILTGGAWASMIFAARVDDGVITVDLGWDGDDEALRELLAQLDATPADVTAVFLTHGHLDHVAAWPYVEAARFHLGAAEVDPFLGLEPYDAWVPQVVTDVVEPDRPAPDQLTMKRISADTAFTFGADTVRAFLVPGHTPGSTAYLFRRILFVGDAVTWTPVLGFHSARREYSDDVAQSRRSLETLWDRVARYDVDWVCTAHGKCAAMDSTFRREALR